ncbi:F0F1 ATP synthase subunit gamma [Rubrimonas cliftonensis]|uniref:ATP synthase gamma chain n=1 Tax=Rubrimonas cliftonensis TaxID=89524 RepID=A0A1H4EVF8_9RHOB|nr:F0F1 ATP synthase subunit gamma [Rubrimonas cliftonensis]SEA88969.1 ATP synthase F1 subcomplex gamma subunit [Rubrimonas cliftonensis]
MPSLKDLKNRINSVKNTRKITKAMQMVAAAKLRRAQEAAEAARPYAERMEGAVANLAAAAKGSPTAPTLFTGTGRDDTHLLLVCTSERGLCGGFNSAIVRLARRKIAELQAAGKTVKIITVGKKGRDQLRRDYGALLVSHVDMTDVKRVGYGDARKVADDVLGRFAAGEFDVCWLFYSVFKSVIAQEPVGPQIIPVTAPEQSASEGPGYEYEPDEDAILADLLPRSVAVRIFTALLENAASEQGARMSAMDNATRNAGDMIDRLNMQYNRSRQAAITTELIEIIAGAEAL